MICKLVLDKPSSFSFLDVENHSNDHGEDMQWQLAKHDLSLEQEENTRKKLNLVLPKLSLV